MLLEIGLLDTLSLITGCRSMSDLRFLEGWQQVHLARALEKIPACAASLAEWNDALVYLARDPPRETAEAAREQLIRLLSRSDGTPCPKSHKKKSQEETAT